MSDARIAYSKVAAPRKLEAAIANRWDLFPFIMVVMVLLTLVAIFHVWSRVTVIDLNLQLSESSRILKEQQQEQNRLTLEVASMKNPARVEALAKGELGMDLPTEQQVVVVR